MKTSRFTESQIVKSLREHLDSELVPKIEGFPLNSNG